MKNRFKNRKAFQKVLNEMGLVDKTFMELTQIKGTNRSYNVLVNPQRRMLKVLLNLPQELQEVRLQQFQANVDSTRLQRELDNQALENG